MSWKWDDEFFSCYLQLFFQLFSNVLKRQCTSHQKYGTILKFWHGVGNIMGNNFLMAQKSVSQLAENKGQKRSLSFLYSTKRAWKRERETLPEEPSPLRSFLSRISHSQKAPSLINLNWYQVTHRHRLPTFCPITNVFPVILISDITYTVGKFEGN
jgi:hypothetical protein